MQFKITLNNSKPTIWRRIQVPSTYTFWDLHCAIQDAMDWTNSHLHGFYITNNKGRTPMTIIQMPVPECDYKDTRNESKEKLLDWFPNKLKQCIYTYDMGDSWDHTILFEKILPVILKKYPVCIAGKNTCPPGEVYDTTKFSAAEVEFADPKLMLKEYVEYTI